MNKNIVKTITFGVIVVVVCIAIIYKSFISKIINYISNLETLSSSDQYITNLGYLGGFLSGSIGLILTFFSLIFLALTFLDQSRKNEITEIENRIFKLLEALMDIKNQHGMSQSIKDFLEKNEEIDDLILFKKKLKENHSNFSHFFRMLYQTLKYINNNESAINNKYFKTSVDSKVKDYTNIIRSYLDTDLLTCLAINCYCLDEEAGEYKKYKELLERYEFFEHLPNVLPVHFSSYLYYNKTAFGNSTWFKPFDTIQTEMIRLSKSYQTMDLSKLFLYSLCEKKGEWQNKNKDIKLNIEYLTDDKIFYLTLKGIKDSVIGENLDFQFKIQNNILVLSSTPSSTASDLDPKIIKDKNRLRINYVQDITPQSEKFIYEISIYFEIKSPNTLEIETKISEIKRFNNNSM